MDAQLQLELETLFNKNQTIPRLKLEFEEAGVVPEIIALGVDPKFGLSLLAHMELQKRASLPTMIGILRHHFKDALNPSQACADELMKASHVGLVEWNSALEEFVILYTVSKDVRDELDKYQYPLPMVIPPLPVKTNSDTGYLTIQNSVILRDNHHEEDICLDHINSMNQIKLKLNLDVARMIQNSWRGLDKSKPGEEKGEYEKRVAAFNKYDKNSRDIMELLSIAGDEFYLTHKYDKRGRCYCQGYHVNYQGNPWNKAVVEFAQGEVVK
jgi:hypothetical protein